MSDVLASLALVLVEAEDTSLHLSWIDAIFILFLGFGFVSAHRLGVFGEFPRAVAWLAALVIGLRWYPYVAEQLEANAGAGPENSAFYAFLLISLFFLSVGYVIGMTIGKLRKKTPQGGLDLWGGFILGPIKMTAAYAWVVVALLLLPSVWTRNRIGLGTLSGNVVMRYCKDIRGRVESSAGGKDAVDDFIERKKRKAADEEIDQPTEGSS